MWGFSQNLELLKSYFPQQQFSHTICPFGSSGSFYLPIHLPLCPLSLTRKGRPSLRLPAERRAEGHRGQTGREGQV